MKVLREGDLSKIKNNDTNSGILEQPKDRFVGSCGECGCVMEEYGVDLLDDITCQTCGSDNISWLMNNYR